MSNKQQDAIQMTSIKRVVTGFDQSGHSVVTSDEMPPRSAAMKLFLVSGCRSFGLLMGRLFCHLNLISP